MICTTSAKRAVGWIRKAREPVVDDGEAKRSPAAERGHVSAKKGCMSLLL